MTVYHLFCKKKGIQVIFTFINPKMLFWIDENHKGMHGEVVFWEDLQIVIITEQLHYNYIIKCCVI